MPTNLDNIFRETAKRHPHHDAIVGPADDDRLSYRALDEAIEATADRLRNAGVLPGMAIALHYASGVQYIVQNYAIWRCRAVSVPIAMELAPQEKRALCAEIRVDAIVSSTKGLRFSLEIAESESVDLGEGSRIVWLRASRPHPDGFHAINAAFIRFTSGTTGASKGVVLSHETVNDRIHAANGALAISMPDRIMWLLSMSYHFTVSIVSYLSFGATIILPKNKLATAIVEACRRHRATLLYGSPMHIALMADYPRGTPLPDLRIAISTTTAIDVVIAKRFRQRYGIGVSQALGIIEIGLPCINLDFPGKGGSVGKLLPAYELRLDDVGHGPDMKEIYFRGPGFLDAYYHPWRTRDQLTDDGWFATHDVGNVDADGCLYLHGRSKDVINVAGMKFFPREVETVLNQHACVKESGVFGAPHSRTGQSPRANVVLEPDVDPETVSADLRRHCLLHIAAYKVPEKFNLVEKLPKSASGKILHRTLK